MALVISIILTAFITGALARFAVPGPDPMPAWLTIIIGLGGTLMGLGIVYAITGEDAAWTGIAGFLCAITLVVIYRRFIQKRPLWGRRPTASPRRASASTPTGSASAVRESTRTRSGSSSPPR